MNRLLHVLLWFNLALVSASLARAAEIQTIALTNGTTLVGKVVAESATEVTFHDSVLGSLTFSPAAIKSRTYDQSTAAPGTVVSPLAPTSGSTTSPPPAVGSTLGPSVANPGTPAHQEPVWTRSLQLSWGYMSGAAPSAGQGSARNLSVNMGIERATARHIGSIIGKINYARAKPAPPYAHSLLATLQYDYILSPKNRIVSQTSFLRDTPKTIKHHTEELLGFARVLVQTSATTLMVAPGLAYSFGEKEYVGDVDDRHFGYGVYQVLSHTFSPALSVQQKLKGVRSFTDPQYIRASASVTLTAHLKKTVAFQTSLEATYDGRPAPGIKEIQIQTNTGLQFQF